MSFCRFFKPFAAALTIVCCATPSRAQQTHFDVTLRVDATHAVQGYLLVHETMAVPPGPLTLVYPKWIPGEFAPNGPIPNVADIAISADGKSIPWTRDTVDLYAFHADVPAHAGDVSVDFTFLGGGAPGFDTARLATPNMLSLEWNKVMLTPFAANDRNVTIAPSIELPTSDWKYATALTPSGANAATISFAPTTLNSPIRRSMPARTRVRSSSGCGTASR